MVVILTPIVLMVVGIPGYAFEGKTLFWQRTLSWTILQFRVSSPSNFSRNFGFDASFNDYLSSRSPVGWSCGLYCLDLFGSCGIFFNVSVFWGVPNGRCETPRKKAPEPSKYFHNIFSTPTPLRWTIRRWIGFDTFFPQALGSLAFR